MVHAKILARDHSEKVQFLAFKMADGKDAIDLAQFRAVALLPLLLEKRDKNEAAALKNPLQISH